jgi:YggT family protein
MQAIADIFSDILSTLLGLYATVVMLRFIFQLVKADFYNDISQAVVKATSPLLVPLRRVIPGLWGLDMAALVLALAIHLLTVAITLVLKGFNPLDSIGLIVIYSLLKLITGMVNIFTFCLLVSIVLSFVAPMSRHPAAVLVFQIAEPMMAPFRKIIPPFGGIDISPIFVFLALGVFTKLIAAIAAQFMIPVGMMWLFILV